MLAVREVVQTTATKIDDKRETHREICLLLYFLSYPQPPGTVVVEGVVEHDPPLSD